MLCFSQTISNIGNCTAFIFMAGVMTLVEPEWHYTYSGRRLGQILIFFWETSIFAHLFIAANRAIAVNFPTRYRQIFGDKTNTRILVTILWIIATLQASPYTFPVCSQQFDPVSFTLAYAEGWCGELTEKYGDLTVSIIIVSCISFLDITTFLRLHQMRKTQTNNGNRAREACVQSVLLMFCECSFFYLSYMSDNPWYAFASTTFIWVFTHAVDGVVVICFSGEIRRYIFRRNKTTTVQPSAMYTVTMARKHAGSRTSECKTSSVC
uniref:G_PROTEIN_RECEP_F1_2 domain-containing protein n=1 Tax=Steinernema glaseri TaxID=37863 RepID=A0A1I7Y0B9_9BILA